MLELAVARELYERYPDFSEGQLAKIRSHVVSRASCAVVAAELGLGSAWPQAARRVPQEELERLSGNRNVLAALLEAALGALFLEYGFEQIEDSVVGAFAGRIEYALHDLRRSQDGAAGGARAARALGDVHGARRRGPAARPHVHVRGDHRRRAGRRRQAAPSKKAAEQEAAREALASLGSDSR